MKKIILLIALLTFLDVTAQTRPANIEIPILIYDNSGLPDNSRVLTCGIDSMATDSIDSFLGEFWLYCPWDIPGFETDCIPYDHFEAVLDIPVEPDPNSFDFGSWKDFRQGMIPYSGIKTYTICYLPYDAATALYISWDFPEGVTGLLQDGQGGGGLIFNYQMPDSGTFTHPSLIELQGHNQGVFVVLTYQNSTPVELISFNASIIDYKVQLNWKTATETNNQGFEIERTSPLPSPYQGEGGEAGRGWEKIGFVPGFGTTTEPKSYSFIDENVTTGIYKYHLKQIDFDGTFTYSNEIEVEVDFSPKEFVLYQNYPNPFNPKTVISYQLPVSGNVTLKVYDILGNEVTTLVNEEKQPGVYEVEFNPESSIRNLASGIYFYQLKVGSFTDTKKMILAK